MSSIIDSRVVEARFENSDFITKIRGTLDALSQLQKGLQLTGATRGIADVSTAASRMDLSRIGDGVDRIASKFNALAVVATAAISRITFQAVEAAERIIKSFSFGPIMDGFKEYELKLGSTQTILANTAKYGTTLKEVNAVLNDLNRYSDKTIYNFGDMTKNIGLFTNAGIRIEDAASMIKGFSNAAAASGTNAMGAAHAAYQLSQALSTGTIRLMDWRSLTNVGMGNKNMQEGIIQIADAMGELEKHETSAHEVQQNFNASLEKNWLTSGVMSKYLRIMAGDIDEVKMKQIGLTDAQIKNFVKTQKTAEDAATKVRTATQLFSTLKEAIGSGWSATFEIIVGNFTKATKMFTNVNNVLSGFVGHWFKARQELLKGWAEMGGRKALIDGLSNAFQALISVLKPIGDAFHEVFPPKSSEQLVDMTKSFRDFMENLKIGADTADLLKRSFAGVFAFFSIIGQIISGLVGGIKELIGVLMGAGDASGGILDLSAGIGDFLVALNETLRESGAIKTFFHGLATVLSVPLKLLAGVAKMIGGLFTGFDHHGAEQVSDALGAVGDKLSLFDGVGQRVIDTIKKIGEFLSNLGHIIGEALADIGTAIAAAITPETFDASLKAINTGLFGALVYMIHDFVKKGMGSLKVDFGGGMLKGVTDTLGAATGVLKSMQAQIKADTIMKIAMAMGILTASILVLSMIDGKKLTKAFVGISVGIAGLEVSLTTLTKIISFLGAAKLPFITVGLIGLGVALLLYAGAMKILSTMDWSGILKGLSGLAGSLAAVAVGMRLMPKGMLAQAAALVAIGVAINAIAVALKIFNTMSWDDMAHGLAALAGSLGVIAGAVRLMPKSMVLQAAGLLALGVALNAIATAMKIFGTMDIEHIAQALYAMGGALGTIAIAISLMPKSMALQAVGLLGVAVALNVIAGAMKIFGTMSWDEISHGLVALGGSLLVLAVGLSAMGGTMGGAAALLLAAAALAVFTPILITLGNLDWGTISKGLTALALTFLVLGLSATALAPLAPVLLAISAALLMVGAGIALIGAGAFLFATAFGIIVSTTVAAIRAAQELGATFYKTIPKIAEAFAKGIINIAKVIAQGQAEITKAMISIMASLIDAIAKNIPKIVKTVINLVSQLLDGLIKIIPKIGKVASTWIHTILDVLVDAIPAIAHAGLLIVLGFLDELGNHMPELIRKGVEIISQFIIGIGYGALTLITVAAETLIAFLHGLADAIRTYEPQLMAAGWDIAKAIAEGFWDGLRGGLGGMFGKVADLFGNITGIAFREFEVNSPSRVFMRLGRYVAEGFAIGLVGGKDTVMNGLKMISDAIQQTVRDIRNQFHTYNADLKSLKREHKDLEKAIRDDNEAVEDATQNLHELQNAKKLDHDAIEQAKRDLRDAKEARNEDTKALKKNEEQQKETTKSLERARKELEATEAASEAFAIESERHRQQLKQLGHQYDEYTKKIEAATQALDDAIQTRDQYRESLVQQYSDLPDIPIPTVTQSSALSDITGTTTLEDYIKGIEDQTTATEEFMTTLAALQSMGLSDEVYDSFLKKGPDALLLMQDIVEGGQAAVDEVNALALASITSVDNLSKDTTPTLLEAYEASLHEQIVETAELIGVLDQLRNKYGLSDAMYEELLSKGVAALPLAEEILAGGQDAVTELNNMSLSISEEANYLGRTASEELYQAGVDIAEGILKGLRKKRKKIREEMEEIADDITKAVKEKLKIKSPSEVMAELGEFMMKGLAQGLKDSEHIVQRVMREIGERLVETMQKYVDEAMSLGDTVPDITPVVSHGNQRNTGRSIEPNLTIGTSATTATNALAEVTSTKAALIAAAQSVGEGGVTQNVSLTQNNFSPKALSVVEIYRQTNNQLSKAKGALTK